ncbi:TPA: N-6 DNA methylase [Streptococcus suis]
MVERTEELMIAFKSEIAKKINKLDGKFRFDQIFYDWVKVMAVTIENNSQYHLNKKHMLTYEELFKKYGRNYFEVFSECFALLIQLFLSEGIKDHLGEIYHELRMHNANKGQFFTPFSASLFLADRAITSEILEESQKRTIRILEPACGAGSIVLAQVDTIKKRGGNLNRFEFTCCDIDENVLMMCFVQMALAGANVTCILGNMLQDEIREKWIVRKY